MSDDDLDLDLDLDAETPTTRAPRRGLFSRRPKPAPPSPQAAPPTPAKGPSAPAPVAPKPAAPAASQAAPDAGAAHRSVTVMAARKPGLVARMLSPVSSRIGKVHAPVWNLRNFGLGVLILALLVLVVENWPAMRLSFLGLHVDLPKALVLIVVFGLGFALGWLLSRRRSAEHTDS